MKKLLHRLKNKIEDKIRFKDLLEKIIEKPQEKIRRLFSSGIRNKLIILLVIIALLPIITLSYFEINSTRHTIRENFISSTKREIKQVDNQIEMYFSQIKSNTRMLANNGQIKEARGNLTTYLTKRKQEELQLTPLENGGTEADIYRQLFNYVDSLPRADSTYAYVATREGGYLQSPTNRIAKN